MSCRVVIADDHQILRQGLRTLLEKEPDVQVVGEAKDGRQALSMVRELMPHVVVMDVKMPDLEGIEATRQIRSEFPQVKVIALSMYSDRRLVKDMLKAGANGYLLKDCAFEELAQAIRLAMSNKTYLSPGVADVMVKDYLSNTTASPTVSFYSVLRTREREVLQLIAEGKRTAQIAELLHISIKTVETHRQHIMQKLSIRSIAELTKYAIREGLTPLEE
jgi:two-component system response regulator NreC